MAELGGRPLIEHAVSALSPHVGHVVIAGAPWRDLPGIVDLPSPGLGPLGGIAAALVFARDHGFARVLTIGCDMPRVPAALLETLLLRSPGFCPDAPVLGLWPAELAGNLLARLATGAERSIRGWARSVGARPVAAPGPLANVNTPADLATL